MNIIEEQSLNGAVIACCNILNRHGTLSEALDNQGDVTTNLVLYNTMIKVTNPIDRYLNIPGRNNNIYAMIAETFWMLAGRNKIGQYLEFYLPRAKNFSDDGKTWRGAYGPRIYNHDQLDGVVQELRKNPLSRQGIVSVYDQSLDAPMHIPYGTKDLPCNNMLYFYSRADDPGKLNIHVTQRSGDVIWGIGSINIFSWTMLLEYMADILDLEVGYYTHYVNNLHVYLSYEVARNQYKDIIGQYPCVTGPVANPVTGFFSEVDDIFIVMNKIVDTCEEFIDGQRSAAGYIADMGNIINGLPDNSSLQEMVRALSNYTLAKFEDNVIMNTHGMSNSIVQAVMFSKFTNFSLQVDS